ncbi:tyrosine-protein kinase family protein [Thermotalea metallivorans]|uniref:CobQ/CobB/MinD/ParA nucleotide binding domain-containing protein n=1 Tax=Thermotalea metallivorans TaxID=520762 RepID=A0A140L9Z1_9FIRM|nr:tyrosine-protein kinase family protein [Thermotalea metallivorans]KXG77366.1 hypothetical protein AN619_04920 [Thermotalea metallivorans]
MSRIHCIFEKADEAIVDAIRKNGEVIQWDYTFGTAMRFLASTEEIPEIIIASEFASTGKKEDLLEYIERMKRDAKGAKIVILLSPERAKDREFLLEMDATGVEYYPAEDIYLEDIKKWTTIRKNDNDIKVVFAANMEELEEPLRVIRGIDIVETVFEREVIVDVVERRKPDVVLLSPRLPGSVDLIDIAWELKRMDVTLIFLADTIDPQDLTIQRMREQGVDEIIFKMPKIGELEDIIKNRKKKGNNKKVYEEPQENEEASKGGLFRKAMHNIPKIQVSVPKIQINKPSIPALPKRPRRIKAKKGITRLDNVIVIFSPNPSGKTFVSVNLAAAFANAGIKTAILDCTRNLGLHTWLNLPLEEDGLSKALQETENVLDFSYQPKLLHNIEVITQDPGIGAAAFQGKQLGKILTDLSESCDVVIVDLGLDIQSEEALQILQKGGYMLVIGDPDYHHSVTLQLVMDELIEKGIIELNRVHTVYNRYIDGMKVPISDVEAATGMGMKWRIPEATKEVYESIRHGIPASMFSIDLKKSFVLLAQDLMEMIKNDEIYETIS